MTVRQWRAVPIVELSAWAPGTDTHWMAGRGGIHVGTGPQPETCAYCADGCDWHDCTDPPTDAVTGHVETAPTLFDAAPVTAVTLMMCAEHAARARAEAVAVEPI